MFRCFKKGVLGCQNKTRSNLICKIIMSRSLETALTKRGVQLLNCDDHEKFALKSNKKVSSFRPDVAHQTLLALLDSPLNKFGHLQVFMRTQKGLSIEVNPSVRMPRTFKRFSGLMAVRRGSLSALMRFVFCAVRGGALLRLGAACALCVSAPSVQRCVLCVSAPTAQLSVLRFGVWA